MKFIIVGAGEELNKYTWADVANDKNVQYLDSSFNFNGLLKTLKKIHCSPKLNKIIKLPFKKIWWRFSTINNVEFDDDMNFLVLGDTAFGKSDISYLNNLKLLYNVKIVVVILNPVSKISKELKGNIDKVDMIFSSDYEDALKFGYTYVPTVYSKKNVQIKIGITSDIFFVGAVKDRYDMLIKCFEKFKYNNLKIDYYISGVDKNKQKYKDIIKYNNYLHYAEILDKVENSNCIFEILQKSQTAITYRTMEALCYNKKLVTNNQYVKKLPFYNDKYIQVFDDVSDINIDFIREKIDVNYGYNDEYSPRVLLKLIAQNYKCMY